MDKKFLQIISLSAFMMIGLTGLGRVNALQKYPPPMKPPSSKEIKKADEDCRGPNPDCALFQLWSIPAFEACSEQYCDDAMSLLKEALSKAKP